MKRALGYSGLGLLVLLAGPLLVLFSGEIALGEDWRSADRTSVGIAPDPKAHPEALIQVYAARAFNWRGAFAVHTWIATKPAGADTYTVHQVVGWRARRGLPVVVSEPDMPDRSWYGARPHVIGELRGDAAAAAIPEVLDAITVYPFAKEYTLWPGPNSNTFVAWVGRRVPALDLDLPPTAIGKDYLPPGDWLAPTPSGRGVQFTALGILGVLVSPREGLEFNLLGLHFGVHPLNLRLRLPGIGVLD